MLNNLFWKYISARLDKGKTANDIERYIIEYWRRPSMPEQEPIRMLGTTERVRPDTTLRPAAYRPEERGKTLIIDLPEVPRVYGRVQTDKPRVRTQGKTLDAYLSGKY